MNRFVLISLISSLLFGCATYQGDGVVVQKQLYSVGHKRIADPIKDRTKNGALVGATSGGALGGLLGSFMGGISIPANVLTGTLIGALGGGLILGGIGAVIGSGVGLMQYGLTPSKKEVWQYQVKSSSSNKILKINQKTSNIPLHSKVKIMEDNGSMFIRRK